MGVRVHRRIELLHGVHLNWSRSGVSLSVQVGPLGTLNLSARGLQWYGRTPIKGVSYHKRLYPPRKPRARGRTTAGRVIDAEYRVLK